MDAYKREFIKLAIEGKLLKRIWYLIISGEIFKRSWTYLLNGLDRKIGILARAIYKKTIPVNSKKVFFHTQESCYTCNPKYICEELHKKRPDIEIVWRIANKKESGVPSCFEKAPLNSIKYFYEIFSSKIIITNSFLYLGEPFSLKRDQTLIETWHGSLGIKRHSKDVMNDSKLRKRALIKTGKMTTYCISNSTLETDSLKSTYWPHTPMLEYGHARNDLFFPQFAAKRCELKKSFCSERNLDDNVHFIMYAPTFRNAQNFDCYALDFDSVLDTVTSKFGGEWYILLRYHPALLKVYKKRGLSYSSTTDRIINVTEYFDMQELIAITDIAITDYSSWIYDFILLRKPGFIFATDIEQYNNERGFYYPLESTPFAIAHNNYELLQNILAFDEVSYLKKLEEFLKDKGCIEDGHASERIVALIEKVIDNSPL